MGPIWVLSAPDEPHVGPMNLAIRDGLALIRLWIIHWIHCLMWDIITHPCPNFCSALTKQPLKIHEYRKLFNIRHTKFQNLTVSRLVLQLLLPNPLKPGVK